MNKCYPDKSGADLFRQRCQNILDATNFVEPDKVPVGMDYLNWPYGYAGVHLDEVIHDPEANADAYCKFMNDIEFDFTMNPGYYFAYDAYEALGSDAYLLTEDRCTVQHNQATHKFMDFEEYEILKKSYHYFSGEYYPKKVVPAFKKSRTEAYEALKKAAECVDRLELTKSLITRKCVYEHQIVPLGMCPQVFGVSQEEKDAYGLRDYSQVYFAPVDVLFDTLRGMEDLFCDLIDDPDTVEEACAAIGKVMSMAPPVPDHEFKSKPFPFGFSIYHSASYLNAEMYDRFWFQGFKKAMLPAAEKGLKIYLKGEGAFLHTIERFKEFPKGSIIIQLDQDDPYEAYKRIGGHQVLCTGLNAVDLIAYNKQECFDKIKRCFDTFAPGGGFMFYQNMPLFSPGDAKPEVVREVWEFANECAKGRY